MSFRILGPDDPALNVLARILRQHLEWDTTLTIVSWSQYRRRLIETLTADQAPHQAACIPGHLWLPELVHAGYLVPLNLQDIAEDVIAQYAPADILPSVAKECNCQGKQYMLPLFTDGHILFYNADKVALACQDGVPVISPHMLRDLSAKAHHPPKSYGLALKAHPSEIFLDWLPFLWEEGGQVLDAAGKPVFAGEAGVRALELYCSLREFCPVDTHTYGNAEIANALKNGLVALASTWGGQAAALLLDPENAYSQLYRTGVYSHPWNATWGVCIPANQTGSMQGQVLSVILAALGPEEDREITRVAGSPVRQSNYSIEALQRYAWLPAQYEMLKRCRTLPAHPKMGSCLDILYRAVYAAFRGEATPKQALVEAEATVRDILVLQQEEA